ncbi:UNVERIFIED_CONTAM: dockerin type I repeat protein [Acetivibrio alkalicellulosi]
MKKGVFSIVIMMIITMMISSVYADGEASFSYGDLDGDGQVTSNDYQLLKRHVLGMKNITDSMQLKAADVNGDGKINSIDLVLIRRYILEVISAFPVEVDADSNYYVKTLGKWTLYSTTDTDVIGEFDEEANIVKLKIINNGSSGNDIKLVYNEVFEVKNRYTSLWIMNFLYPSYSLEGKRTDTNYKLVLENAEDSQDVFAELKINNAERSVDGPIPNPSWPLDLGKEDALVRVVLDFGNLNEKDYEIHISNGDINFD